MKQVKESIAKDIPEELEDKVRFIIFKYSIEEWLCDGLCLDRNNDPKEVLNNYVRDNSKSKRGYEHSMLPDFACKIDVDKLRDKNKEFKEFLSYMQGY